MPANISLQDGINATPLSNPWSCITSQVTLSTVMSDTVKCWNTPYACTAFQTLRGFNMNSKRLPFFPLEPDTSHLYNWLLRALLYSLFTLALLCLQQMPQQFVASMTGLKDAGIHLGNTGQLLWQPCPTHTMISSVLRSFPILCRLQGNNPGEENYFKVRKQSKRISMNHKALSYQKDDDGLSLARQNSPRATEQRHMQRSLKPLLLSSDLMQNRAPEQWVSFLFVVAIGAFS